MRVACGPAASIERLEETETYTSEQAVDVIPTEATEVDLGGHEDASTLIRPIFARLWTHDICRIGLLELPLIESLKCYAPSHN